MTLYECVEGHQPAMFELDVLNQKLKCITTSLDKEVVIRAGACIELACVGGKLNKAIAALKGARLVLGVVKDQKGSGSSADACELIDAVMKELETING